MNHRSTLVCLLAAALLASACAVPAWLPGGLRPYRPDVQQGNIITKDMVDQLRTGMTRDQVRFLLGTPMLSDVFHQNRWDYPYFLLHRRTGETQIRKMYVVFEDGKLARFSSDSMPTEPLADSLILGQKLRPAATPPSTPTPAPTSAPTPASAPDTGPAAKPAPAPASPESK
jgi:outer membrane protein assembly factor BamE